MNYTIEISETAENHISDAALWYEEQKEGLGKQFLSAVKVCFDLIERNPHIYIKLYKILHKTLIKTYPYFIFFTISEDHQKVVIIAVLHTSRNPKNWKKLI